MGAAARVNAAIKEESKSSVDSHIANAIPYHHHRLIEAYGKPIEVGGVYGFTSGLPIPVTVVDIKPVIDRMAPPDSYTIVVMAQVTVQAASRARVRNLLMIEEAPKVGDSDDPSAEAKANQPGDLSSPITLTDL